MKPGRFCAVVPAAGRGRRMGDARPKQYLRLHGGTVIEHALAALLAHPGLERLVVVLAADDAVFAGLAVATDARIATTEGGAERADSVRAGLAALAAEPADTIVLVHDAARPCVTADEIGRLLAAADPADGALLAVPVRDTLKRADAAGRVQHTVDREGLWQALTPQAFGLGALRAALEDAREGVTDEAAAMERAGHAPRLVEGEPGNIKVTRAGDLELAAAVLRARAERGE